MKRHGRARINSTHPEATGLCDRCGCLYDLKELQFEMQWMGPRLARTGYRICPRCFDKPFIFFKPILLGPDPLPVKEPRPPWWYPQAIGNGNLIFDDGSNWVTEDGNQLTVENNTSTDT